MHEHEALAIFDGWTEAFVAHIQVKGIVPGTMEAERGAQSTTQ